MIARAGRSQDHDGYTKLSEDAFLKYFANGLEHGKAEILYAEQQPTAAAAFRRKNDGRCLALQTHLLCGVEERQCRLTWKRFLATTRITFDYR